MKQNFKPNTQGRGNRGGSGGVGPPLELEIYLVKFLKIRKKKFFFSIGPPLGKNRSPAPEYSCMYYSQHTSCEDALM